MKAMCLENYVVESDAIDLVTGAKFTKKYSIKVGIIGRVVDEGCRLMVRLENPLVADNQDEAPYESELYRVFLYSPGDKAKWGLDENEKRAKFLH